ncbi:MAG TPA: hypothetical protein VFR76_08925, partial [Verrucomicrobiae bacterium]|nr:hypothetical protein [Verrucomicrobiae bacterium]
MSLVTCHLLQQMPTPSIADELVRAARQLRAAARDLNFTAPVTCVYNPLDYAWPAHETYLRRFGNSPKRVVFLGMNPGPFGMAQTGVPFGEVAAVRDWLGIHARIREPPQEHPRRPIEPQKCIYHSQLFFERLVSRANLGILGVRQKPSILDGYW